MFAATLALLVTFPLPQDPPPQDPPPQPAPSAQLLGALEAAETTFWAALEDASSPELLALGFARLAVVRQLPGADRPEVQARISQLQQDLEEQQEMAHDTLRANFPAYRLLRDGLCHEVLVDDPWVVATVNSAGGIAEMLRTTWPRQAQYDVAGTAEMWHAGDELLAAPEARWDLVNEAYFAFATNPRIWLDPRQDRSPPAGQPSTSLLLDVGFSDFGSAAPLWRVTGTGTVRERGAPIGQEVRAFGFALDRRGRLLWLLAPLVLALGVGCSRSRSAPQRGAAWTAAILAFVVGATSVLASLWLFRDWLPPPESLTATSLWAPLLVAALVCLAPLVFVQVLPARLGESAPDILALWRRTELGAWPALAGGGVPVLGAVLLERGVVVGVLGAIGWLLALRLGHDLGERARLAARARVVLVASVLGALAVAVAGVPAGDWSMAAICWLAGGAVSLAALAWSGASAAPLLLPVVATLAVLSAGALSLCVVAAGAFAALLADRAGRSSVGGASVDVGGAGATLAERLRDLQRAGGAHAPADVRAQVSAIRAGGRVWSRVVLLSELPRFARMIAHGIAREVADEGGIWSLASDAGDADPLRSLRRRLGTTGASVQQSFAGVAAALAGAEAAAQKEESAEQLGLRLAQQLSERGAPTALLLLGQVPSELARALEVARTRLQALDRGEVVEVRLQPLGASKDADANMQQKISAADEDRLFQDYLTDAVGLSAELAALLAEPFQGLGPVEVVAALQRIVDVGGLDGDGALPVACPPPKAQEQLERAAQQAAVEAAHARVDRLPDLSAADQRVLEVASHLGVAFDLHSVSTVVGTSRLEVARQLDGMASWVEDVGVDGAFAFKDAEHVRTFRAAGRVFDGVAGGRLKQYVLEDLHAMIEVQAALVELRGRGAVDAAMHALRLAAEAIEGGGEPGRFVAAAVPGLEFVLEDEDRFARRATRLCAPLSDLLDSDALDGDLQRRATALLLRLEESGAVPRRELSAERALAAFDALPTACGDVHADELGLEIARRFSMVGGRETWPGGAAAVAAMLEQRIEAAATSDLLRARARVQLGDLRVWQIASAAPDDAAALREAVALVKSGCDQLARVEGGAAHLGAALWSLGTGLSHALKMAADYEQTGAETVDLLGRALTHVQSHGPHRLEGMILGTRGRARIAWADRRRAAGDQVGRRELLEAAIVDLRDNLELSTERGDREGMLKMPSTLAMAACGAGRFDVMREMLALYERTIEQQVSDERSPEHAYLALGQVALRVADGEGEAVAQIDPSTRDHLDTLQKKELDWLKTAYSPFLDGIS